MASQPIFAPYTPLPSAAPRPNIRIAYIAGPAQIAVNQQLQKLPTEALERTLEELQIAGLAGELIAAAEQLLSPAMYRAFLRWGETVVHFTTRYDTDEEGSARCEAFHAARKAMDAVRPVNIHDLALKMMPLNAELADCPDFFSMCPGESRDEAVPAQIGAIVRDSCELSPVIALLDDLAAMAWEQSPPALLAIAPSVGAIITDAFRSAREALESDPPVPARLPASIDGYSPFMRGPLIAWRKAYAVYEQARDELAAYERDHYDPAAARYLAIRGDCRQPLTAEMEDQLREVPMDEVQERFDELVMAKHDASERLWTMPAPSASELSTKMQIFVEAEGWALKCAADAIRQMKTDARRFGRHGAFLQSDGKILAAFAGCRHEMLAAYGPDAMTRDEEDAYFARLDAYEQTLLDERADTIEGVIAKLRVAFSRINPNAWSDHAIMDPTSSDFREGLLMDGLFEEMAWRAIEDLARIGGVSLVEQGA